MKYFALFFSFLALAGTAHAGDLIGTCKGFEDGSTLIISAGGLDHTVTLFGVQAPAINQDYGLEAKQQAEALALGKRVKAIDEGQGAGVVIFQGGAVLNTELVKAGLAWADPKTGDAALGALQAQARTAKAGLWAAPNPMPPWDFRKRMTKLQAKERAKALPSPLLKKDSGNVHILETGVPIDSPMSQSVVDARLRQNDAETERIRQANMVMAYREYYDSWANGTRLWPYNGWLDDDYAVHSRYYEGNPRYYESHPGNYVSTPGNYVSTPGNYVGSPGNHVGYGSRF
jgi:endonuclease YncB( thermonuclease family)